MINLSVCRGSSYVDQCLEEDPALSWGADISDPLLTTIAAGRERGRVEIDSVFTNRKNVNIDLPYQNFIQPGSLVGIVEGGNAVNGLLQTISITHVASDNSIQVGSQLSIEREA